MAASARSPAPGQPVVATVNASKTGPPISPYLYGQFIEHGGSLIYSGLWCEMLDDRKFYYAVQPKPAGRLKRRPTRAGWFWSGPPTRMSGRDGGIRSARLIPS